MPLSQSAKRDAERPRAEIDLIHSPFYPADVYAGERLYARVELPRQGNARLLLPVWRLSPLGVELLVTPEMREGLKGVETGTPINLSIEIAKQFCEFRGLVVFSRHQQGDRPLIGIRWCMPEEDSRGDGEMHLERRGQRRWLCGAEFMPTGIAPNPVRFNDFIHFRVVDVSRGGMQVWTSLRNKYLIPGMVLDSVISFPMCAQLGVKLKVMHARITSKEGKDYLALGTQMVSPDRRVLDAIGQYVFQFGPKTSVKELREHGFKLRDVSQGVEYGYVRTEQEYLEVLKLRRLAYASAGKMSPDTPLEEVADLYDSRARILIARYRGEIVATIRLMFHNPEDSFEHETHLKLPEGLPRKDEMVEVTRAAVHPDFRQCDLLYGLISRLIITMTQAKRRWLLSSADDHMIGLYQKLGAKLLNVRYKHQLLGNLDHELFLIDVYGAISGAGVNVFVWNAYLANVTAYVQDQEFVQFMPMVNLRMSMYRLFRPLTPLVFSVVRRRRAAA